MRTNIPYVQSNIHTHTHRPITITSVFVSGSFFDGLQSRDMQAIQIINNCLVTWWIFHRVFNLWRAHGNMYALPYFYHSSFDRISFVHVLQHAKWRHYLKKLPFFALRLTLTYELYSHREIFQLNNRSPLLVDKVMRCFAPLHVLNIVVVIQSMRRRDWFYSRVQ